LNALSFSKAHQNALGSFFGLQVRATYSDLTFFLWAFPLPHTWAAAVLVDELDARFACCLTLLLVPLS
jgi:hypothetical protein